MGWFGRLTPDELRAKLFDARGEKRAALCRKHRDAIVSHFSSWQKVPPGLDPDGLQRYGEGLIGVAQCFAQMGDGSLMQRLLGDGKNSLTDWQDGLQSARALLDERRFEEAIAPLSAMVKEAASMRGPGVDRLLPYTLEFLGEALFHSGRPEEALEPFERALALSGDDEARAACLASLFEVHRYLGDFERAAARADERAALLPPAEAALVRQIAALVRAGEPLLRVVVQMEGKRWELDEAPPPTGRVQFLLERNRASLGAADRCTAEGTALAEEGRYPEALARFEKAAEIDAFAPQCRFLAGLTLLHLRRYREAVKRYAEVERLAPSWYQSRHDAWLANQLACDKLPHEAFLAQLQLDDGELSPEARVQLASGWPQLPSAWLHRGRALKQLGRSDEAATALRHGLELAGDADVRARLSLELGMLLNDAELLRAAEDPMGNPVAAAQSASIRRANHD